MDAEILYGGRNSAGRMLTHAEWLASLVVDGWRLSVNEESPGIRGFRYRDGEYQTLYVASHNLDSARSLYRLALELAEEENV